MRVCSEIQQWLVIDAVGIVHLGILTKRGPTPLAVRQIYLACIISISDYSSIIWLKGQEFPALSLQKTQNMALRKILGVFKTAPILAMEVEAALMPTRIRLNQ